MNDLISRKAAIKVMECINDSICAQQAVDALCELPSAEVTLCHLDSPCEYQNADITMPSAQQKGDIDEAVEYIKNAQEYLRDIGETWCADYLSDAIELLVGERR